jgi:cell division protease FtsH
MSEKIGPVALEGAAGRIIMGYGVDEKEYSERVGAEIDGEVSRIIAEAMKKAEDILTTHRKALDAITERLIEVETIEHDEFEKILIANGIIPKKKQDIEHLV